MSATTTPTTIFQRRLVLSTGPVAGDSAARFFLRLFGFFFAGAGEAAFDTGTSRATSVSGCGVERTEIGTAFSRRLEDAIGTGAGGAIVAAISCVDAASRNHCS